MDPIMTFYVAMILYGTWALEAILAYRAKMFTVQQMRTAGVQSGMPFTGHAAMWSDLLVVSPLLVAILIKYGSTWTMYEIMIVGGIAYVVNTFMHIVYVLGDEPDCLAGCGKFHPAGFVHWVYMGNGLTVVGLFYFCTPHIERTFLVTASAWLALHMLIGTQIITSLLNPTWWKARPHKERTPWIVIGVVWSLLAARTYVLLGR